MAARHSADYRTLASLSRVNLLHALHHRGPQTIAELATATGLHHNTAREHLHRLITAGFVDCEPMPSTGRGRPQLRYRAARGSASAARAARRRKSENRTALVRKLLPISETSASSAPISRQLDSLEDHMEQCGFDADIDAGNSRMVMHDCPFSTLAKENPQVCEVHLALIQDALEDGDGPMEAHDLQPFIDSRTCTVHLHT